MIAKTLVKMHSSNNLSEDGIQGRNKTRDENAL